MNRLLTFALFISVAVILSAEADSRTDQIRARWESRKKFLLALRDQKAAGSKDADGSGSDSNDSADSGSGDDSSDVSNGDDSGSGSGSSKSAPPGNAFGWKKSKKSKKTKSTKGFKKGWLKSRKGRGSSEEGSGSGSGQELHCTGLQRRLYKECREENNPWSPGETSAESECDEVGEMDIVIIMDESGSISEDEYFEQQEFFQRFVAKFTIGPKDVNIGLMEFSTRGYRRFGLKEKLSVPELQAGISEQVYRGTRTNIASALDLAAIELGAGRPKAQKAVVIITDGKHNEDGDIFASAGAVRGTGAAIHTIGIGKSVNQKNLLALSGNITKVHNVKSFRDLADYAHTFSSTFCKKPYGFGWGECNMKDLNNDYVIIIDDSLSVEDDEMITQMDAAKDFIDQFGDRVGPDTNRFAVVQFTEDATTEYHFSDDQTPNSVKAAIDGLTRNPRNTNHAAAFDEAITEYTVKDKQDRPNIVIMYTDGTHNGPAGENVIKANELRSSPIDALILIINIANEFTAEARRNPGADYDDLVEYVGGVDKQKLIVQTDFSTDLSKTGKRIFEALCSDEGVSTMN